MNKFLIDQVKSFYTKYRLIIWPIVTGIACLVVIGLVIIPKILDYLNVRNKISDIQKHATSLEVKAQNLGLIDETIDKQKLQVALTVLPIDQDVPQSMAVLQSIVGKSGLSIKSTAYAAGNIGGGKSGFQLNVDVVGELSAIRNFFIALQEAPQLFQVESIAAQFQGGASTVEAQLPISVFYEALPKTSGPLDQEIPQLTEKEEQLLSKLSTFVQQQETPLTTTQSNTTESMVPLGKADPFE